MGIPPINLTATSNNLSALQSSSASTQSNLKSTTSTLSDTKDTSVAIVNGTSNLNVSGMTAEQLIAKQKELKAKIDALTKELETLNKNLETEKTALLNLKQQYETELAKLKTMQAELETQQKDLENLNEEIEKTQVSEQKTYEQKVSSLSESAKSDYNQEKDGDFNSYLQRIISSAGIGSDSALSSLNSKAANLADSCSSLSTLIKNQGTTVKSLSEQITAKEQVISNINTQITSKATSLTQTNSDIEVVNKELTKLNGGGLSGKELLALVSDAEKKLAKDNNIDLTKGYMIAKGQDDKWHIYSSSGASLARTYGKDSGGLKGSDIVPGGSGYMKNITDPEEGKGRAVYTFSSINEDLTDGEATSTPKCYNTCSPLSFDIDADGVNTIASTVNFDIDGDGKVDTVNNSAEWVLAFDKNKNGIAGENGSELFGDNTDIDGDGKKDGFKNGFEALKALAKKEGLTNDNLLDTKDIKFLSEKYGLGMTKGYGGEFKSLSDLGITEINLAGTSQTTVQKNYDGRGNDLMTQEGATFKVNGQTRNYADIWNAKKNSTTNEKSTVKSSIQIPKINLAELGPILDKALNPEVYKANEGTIDYNAIDEIVNAAKNFSAKPKTKNTPQKEPEVDNDFIKFQKKLTPKE